jgi:phage tail-like protein
MARPDPLRGFRFRIEIDGVQQGGFMSVSGIERETKIEPYREGGINDFEHQLAVGTVYPPLVLKRGLVDPDLWNWHQDVIGGTIERRTITLFILDDAGEQAWHLTVEGAFPAKWTGNDLDATSNGIAAESIEFVHHGWSRQ